jgi:hypothetical protein
MWHQLSIKVHYSEIDNDDTIAAYAQAHGAAILSGDKDMYRYLNADYIIYSDFEVKHGKLYLQQSKNFWHPKPRKLPDPLPITHQKYPVMSRLFNSKSYMKGCPSSLTKYVGNLHILLKPLRASFYFLQGVNFTV